MHFNNAVCAVRHINADHVEQIFIDRLAELGRNQSYFRTSIEELNRDLKRKVEPLEKEASRIRKRLEEIESEITAYVRALGKGQLSIKRLQREIASWEGDRELLEPEYAELQRKISDSISRDYNADVLQHALSNFQTAFSHLTSITTACDSASVDGLWKEGF